MGNDNGLRGTPRYIYVAFVLIICTRYYDFLRLFQGCGFSKCICIESCGDGLKKRLNDSFHYFMSTM